MVGWPDRRCVRRKRKGCLGGSWWLPRRGCNLVQVMRRVMRMMTVVVFVSVCCCHLGRGQGRRIRCLHHLGRLPPYCHPRRRLRLPHRRTDSSSFPHNSDLIVSASGGNGNLSSTWILLMSCPCVLQPSLSHCWHDASSRPY